MSIAGNWTAREDMPYSNRSHLELLNTQLTFNDALPAELYSVPRLYKDT